jgi:hypothetical protein
MKTLNATANEVLSLADPHKLLYTVQQAGAATGESEWTWRKRAYSGVCASVKLSERGRLLIPRSEIDRLINEGFRQAKTA